MSTDNEYKWDHVSVGGVVRVRIDSGKAIAHLDELDYKKWTVLSCPVKDIHFDPETIKILDSDSDGKIRIEEVIAAAKWVSSSIKNSDLLLESSDVLPLDQINDSTEEGVILRKTAAQILSNLGKTCESISVADSSDNTAIFKGTRFNGDGVIIPESSDDEGIAAVIKTCMDTVGCVKDVCGLDGVNEDKVNAFYTAAADYACWMASAEADKEKIFPYGSNTEAALNACEAVKDKLADWFMRCKLIRFDEQLASAVDVKAEKVAAISGNNLSLCGDEIASYPLARPVADGILRFEGINPAWKAAFDTMRAAVLDDATSAMDEDKWNSILAGFEPYRAWKKAEKGAEVEKLGLEYLNGILSDGSKDKILALIAQDKALANELEAVCKVNKLTHLFRDLYRFLKNYVVFSEFYTPDPDDKAIFETGNLFIDERCCKLCLKVDNMGAHADMASLSGMFLIYCSCKSVKLGKTMDIVAVMTDGSTKNLRPGKNGIFYDIEGNDWDAVVTKVVDNPINVRKAFFAPYRKFWNFITEKLNKNVADKDNAAIADLQSKADSIDVKPGEAPKKSAFDIAKFAGIFAAIGMAIGFIGEALVSLAGGISAHPWWQTLLAIIGVMLVISGPSCIIAWNKLRKRDLGPVLNANGWAINSLVKINVVFGKTLTSVAKYPVIKGNDPYREKTPLWKKCVYGIIAAVVIVLAVLWCTGHFDKKEASEQVETVEVVETAEAADVEASTTDE